jgi:hypothetical protein
MIKVKLCDLIDAIEFNNDDNRAFINLKTGEICCIPTEVFNSVKEDNENDFPDWQQDEIQMTKNYLNNPDDYIGIPTQFDVNEYGMMEDFVFSPENEQLKQLLFIAMKGTGAFRRFKDTLIVAGIEKVWYQFREERYKTFALDWCEVNDLEIV